jgi:N-acetylmuramoyl-L-alanine amidase
MASNLSLKTFILAILCTFFCIGCASLVPPPSAVLPPPAGIYHIVGSGETLYRISKTYCADLNEIIRANNIINPDNIGVGDRLFIPGANSLLTVEPYRPAKFDSIEKLVGKKQYKIRWKYITLHHSATSEGNAESFDRYHRKKRMGGLAYHFVIGNGKGTRNGEIEVGWRWTRQKQSSRKRDIQICLVGDFNRQYVREAQFNSLVKLIDLLCRQYNIPLSNIRKHKDIRSCITECPGRNFPFYKILSELRKTYP